jgi:hypothetical protein
MPGVTASAKVSFNSALTIIGACGSSTNNGPDAGATASPARAATRSTLASTGETSVC